MESAGTVRHHIFPVAFHDELSVWHRSPLSLSDGSTRQMLGLPADAICSYHPFLGFPMRTFALVQTQRHRLKLS